MRRIYLCTYCWVLMLLGLAAITLVARLAFFTPQAISPSARESGASTPTTIKFKTLSGAQYSITYPPTVKEVNNQTGILELKTRETDEIRLLIGMPPHGFGYGDSKVSILWDEEPTTINNRQYKRGNVYRGAELTQVIYQPLWTDKLGNIEVGLCCRDHNELIREVEGILATLEPI